MRGGITVDLAWADGKPSNAQLRIDDGNVSSRPVQVVYTGKTVASFTTQSGAVHSITQF